MWPFKRKSFAAATSEAPDYTSGVLNAQLAAATGTGIDGGLASGVEIARGMVGRAMLQAEWSSRPMALTPTILRSMGRDLIYPGQSVWAVIGGELVRAETWDIIGGVARSAARYKLEMRTPSGNVNVTLPENLVVHATYTDTGNWWEGQGPIASASATGILGHHIEVALSNESGGPHGYLLPTPVDPDSSEMTDLKADLKALDGGLSIVRSQLGGWSVPAAGGQQPYRDWVASRIGMNPPEVMVTLRNAVERAVLAVCGVPQEVLQQTDGAGAREGWRRFLHGTIEPLGIMISEAVCRVWSNCGVPTFDRLGASDTAGQARAFQSLAGGGLELEQALELAGFRVEGPVRREPRRDSPGDTEEN